MSCPRPLLLALALLAACTADATSSDDALRGPLGKADAVGSCQDACGDASLDGDCYCDDACAAFGDCCADKAEVCGSDAVACGGLAGLACGDGDYCHYEADAICGAADQTGVCLPTPEACIEVFMPVCGCDGQTYGNACDAHAAGTSVSSEGACAPAERLCGSRGLPGCEDGEFCDFALDAACGATDHPGTCQPLTEVCAQIFAPVCGCDGATYSNECHANAVGVSVATVGECPPASP